MSKKKVQFMCTAFRDGFQSVFGARVLTPDFIPALEAARDAGMTYFEAGGGARFQSLYFYCQEDAFAMMDTFRATTGADANLQTLARGVNVVGLESQPSDVIKMHAELFARHGISTIRNFDALNDVNNLIYSGRAITEAGLKHQVCVTLMQLPPGCSGAHDPDFYEKTLRDILDADVPFDSVCFKDASGTSVPSTVHETIRRARKMLPEGTHIHFHTHETAGASVSAYRAALDAGADAIDLSLRPVSGGTSQPDVLVMWHALRGTEYDLDIDVDKVRETEEIFSECLRDYFFPPEATMVEPLIPWCPMPGGALTANTQMLRDNNIMEKYPAIIRAMGEVVAKGGFGTSVTPVSQFYFQQAFNNVMFGPWKKIAEPYGEMVLGYFGKTPVPPDPEIVKLAREQLGKEPTTRTPLEMNDENPAKGLEPARKILKQENLAETDENLFIVATCKEKGVAFLKGEAQLGVRKQAPEAAAPAAASAAPAKDDSHFHISVNGVSHYVVLQDGQAIVDGRVYDVGVEDGESAAAAPAVTGKGAEMEAPMPGVVLKVLRNAGDRVAAGDPVFVLEAMKMENTVGATAAGVIREVRVKPGDQVAHHQVLAVID
jgi:pyruvate carboxylase subunit B